MSAHVGIYQNIEKSYSTEWANADEFTEKESLRALSKLLGYADGNLFRSIIKPGNKVVIKPNWVRDSHPYNFDIFSVITHSAILRAAVDLAYEALRGEGQIIIADAPQFDCDFDNLLRVTQIQKISAYYWNRYKFEIPILDLRQISCRTRSGFIKANDRVVLNGDPHGYTSVNLGLNSAFVEMPNIEKMYGADYDRKETARHHTAGRHEYLISKTILNADVIINVPKLKVHKKVGITVNAKGMVGINGNKNWIAHYRVGPPASGGDEYPDNEQGIAKTKAGLTRFLIDHLLTSNSSMKENLFESIRASYNCLKPFLGKLANSRVLTEGGNWHGNDTAWRMTADLARIVLFADQDGHIRDTMQRRFFSVVDGIIAGEKEGPLAPTPKPCGVLIAGDNLLAVDMVAARLMGFEWRKIKYMCWLLQESKQPLGIKYPEKDIEIFTNVPEWSQLMQDLTILDLNFEPHLGWQGFLELDR